jgi:hypothetical protein
MKRVNLKILGLKVPIGFFRVYHDDGFVDSIIGHTKELHKKYDQEWCLLDNSMDGIFEAVMGFRKEQIIGACQKYQGVIRKHYHIFYLDGKSEAQNIATRAHEETHALEFFDKLDMLSSKMLDEQKVKINLYQIDEKEVRAHIGSIYALFARGMNPDKIIYKNSERRGFFGVAKKLYEQSMMPERKIFI